MKKLILITFAFCLLAIAFPTQGQVPGINSGAPYVETISGNGLLTSMVACYDFENNPNDSHIYAYNGTNNGCVYYSSGKIGGCYRFVSNDYVSVPDNTSFSFTDGSTDIPVSVNFWLNLTSTSASQWIVSKRENSTYGNEYQFQIVGGILYFQFMNYFGDANSIYHGTNPGDISLNTWDMWTMTYDGSGSNSGIKVYKNGSLLSSVPGSTGTYTGMTNGSSPLHIGTRSWVPGTTGLQGYLDQFIFYRDRELTAANVGDLYASGNGIYYIDFTAKIKQIIKTLYNRFYENISDAQIPLRIAS